VVLFPSGTGKEFFLFVTLPSVPHMMMIMITTTIITYKIPGGSLALALSRSLRKRKNVDAPIPCMDVLLRCGLCVIFKS